jgi:hypothetical protein
MTRAEWEALKPGDVIEATLSGRRYTVTRIARVLTGGRLRIEGRDGWGETCQLDDHRAYEREGRR